MGRTKRPVRVLRQATGLGWLGGALLAASWRPELAAAGLLILAIARAPQFSIADRLTLDSSEDGGAAYGRIRLWGSVSFLLTAALAGWLRDDFPRAPLYLTLVQLTVAHLVSWTLPDVRGAGPPAPPMLRVLLHPVLAPLAVVTALHGASIYAYDSMITLHVERLGLPGSVAGFALALGVSAEVVVLALSPRLLRRLHPAWLAVIGTASGIPRFCITAVTTDPVLLVGTQALHGLGFGLFWVAMVHLAAEHAPEGLENASQASLTSAGFGAGSLLALGTASLLLDAWGTPGLFVAAAGASVLATVAMTLLALRMNTGRSPSTAPPRSRL